MLSQLYDMERIYNNRTDFAYKGNVKEIFTQSYANIGTVQKPIIGSILSSSNRIFINDNGKIDSIHHFHNGKLGLRTTFENDGISNCKETIYSSTDGSIQKTITYSHIHGDEFEFIVLDAGKRIAQKGIKIIENEMTQNESYLYYGETKYRTDYKYDSKERLIHQIRIMEESDLIYDISYNYFKSDDSENWTERLIKHRNEQNLITFSNFENRQIKYYE